MPALPGLMPSAQWEHERIALEAQLNASVRMQIESTREGIRKIGESQDHVQGVRDSLLRVTDLCQQSERLIDNYPFIKQVSRTHQNFVLTKKVHDEFCALDEKVARTARLLEQDKEAERPANLLVVYMHLAKLKEFKEQTLLLMKDAPQTSLFTLRRYFKRLDDLENDFDDFFWRMPRSLLALEPAVAVQMAKVVGHMERTARARFNAILDDLVACKFQAALAGLGAAPGTDPEGALETVGFWQADLALVRDRLVRCFPADFAIMDLFVLLYHRHIHALVGQVLATRTSPADILSVLGWARDYHVAMLAEFGMSQEDLEPRLLDGREPTLIAEYVAMSRQKLVEWIGTLFETERTSFCQRTSLPELDPQNHYYSPAAVDLIQIMKQHVATAATASKGRLVADIVGEVCRSVAAFQTSVAKLLETERNKYLEKPDTAAPDFEYHVIMMGNTSLRWAASLQLEIVQSLEQVLSTEFVATSAKLLKELGDGFVSIAKTSAQVLVDLIFATIQPALLKLFTAAWYGEEVVSQILATLADFFDDYRQYCDEFLFNKLVADVLDRLLFSYIQLLAHKNTKLLMQQDCPVLLQNDVAAIFAFFCQLRDERRVRKAVDALDKLVSLVVSSKKMVFLEFFAFWKVYPDVPLAFLEDVLSRRDDLDKPAIKEIIDTCRRKTLEEKPAEPATSSIFGKLKK